LYAAPEHTIALTGENNAEAIARYLMRFIFFNDDMQIEDVSGETAVFAIYGPQAEEKLAGAGFPAADLPLHHWRTAAFDNAAVTLHRTDPIAGDGYFILCQTAVRETIWQRLLNAGLPVADEAAYDFLRIESAIPRFGRELTQAYIPLEAGLWDDVSFSKGCYIGQEIIARMESRGKLAKKLVQLRPPHPVAPDDPITANGKTAGSITSAAVGPHGPVALGYVKTDRDRG
jgi:aminomethyltransferase